MGKIAAWIKFQIFGNCCPECGSEKIISRGFECINRRVECTVCKKTFKIKP